MARVLVENVLMDFQRKCKDYRKQYLMVALHDKQRIIRIQSVSRYDHQVFLLKSRNYEKYKFERADMILIHCYEEDNQTTKLKEKWGLVAYESV